MSRLQTIGSALALATAIVLASMLMSTAGADAKTAVIQALIYLVIALGLFMFVGNSGVLSFGHIGFVAIGAYTSAVLTIPQDSRPLVLPDLPGFLVHTEVSTPVSLVIAAAVCGAVALVAAVPLMRLSGIGAGIATFSLLIIVQTVAQNWKAMTGGVGTLTGTPTDASLTLTCTVAVVVLLVAYAYSRTRSGLRLQASREDEPAARASGVDVERERRLAFVLSAMVMGVAGGLYAHHLGAFGPDAFYLDMTFLTLAMLVVGGTRSATGAIVGTASLSLINEVLSRWESGSSVGGLALNLPSGSAEIVVAALLVTTLILRPKGLSGGRDLSIPIPTTKEA